MERAQASEEELVLNIYLTIIFLNLGFHVSNLDMRSLSGMKFTERIFIGNGTSNNGGYLITAATPYCV